MKRFGLLGYPLGHSFSQKYFHEKFSKLGLTDHVFDLFPFQNVKDFFESVNAEKNLCGFSVTIPHKESVIPFLDELDATAQKIGAVNCVKASTVDGILFLKGFNTDEYGFRKSIKPFLEPHHNRALVLGTGGASKAIVFALKNIGVDVWTVSRNKKNTDDNCFLYSEVNENVMNAFRLIVNCTPVGMFPNDEKFPELPYEYISDKHFFYDLVYKPERTVFLEKAQQKGAMIMNGLDMLYAQADKAWEIWNK
jgi:shikimate dehydrogenase